MSFPHTCIVAVQRFVVSAKYGLLSAFFLGDARNVNRKVTMNVKESNQDQFLVMMRSCSGLTC